MKRDSLPPNIKKELAPVRKTVDGLRTALANYRGPEALEPSNVAVRAAAKAHNRAMKEFAPLGFNNLGDAGERCGDGSVAVSRWLGHSDGTIAGWLGFISPENLVVFLITETSGGSYVTTQRGGTALSLARPTNVSYAFHERTTSMADVVRDHRERLSSSTAAGIRPTKINTLGRVLDVMERLHQNSLTWRAPMEEHDLLRADLKSVLEHLSNEWEPHEFRLAFPRAAKWLDVEAGRSLGNHIDLAPGPLAKLLASPPRGRKAKKGTPGIESKWLFHSEFELKGRRLQMLDVSLAGSEDEGVILDATAGVYVIEARVMTYGIDRRISRVRVHQKRHIGKLGKLAGEVAVDLAAVAICDVDCLAGWARDHQDKLQRWGDKLWLGGEARAGLYSCEPAKTVVAFVESGFGDGTYPVYFLTYNGRRVGLEAEFLSPETGYLK